MKSFNLNFDGYYSDSNRVGLPNKSGIYLVFTGKSLPGNKVDLRSLIYIGQAKDLRERLTTHDKHEAFLAKCNEGELPYYSYALACINDLDIVENALVYNTKLELNDKLKFHYNHSDSVRLIMNGACGELFGTTICIDVKRNGIVETYSEEDLDCYE